jgi:hypothetical protein
VGSGQTVEVNGVDAADRRESPGHGTVPAEPADRSSERFGTGIAGEEDV